MKIKSLFLAIAVITAVMLSSCESDSDRIVGSWSRSFGLRDNYTDCRVIADKGESFIQTFTFEKGENGKGTFTDYIVPVFQNPDRFVLASKIKGTWEIKDGKLYLDYSDLTLTNVGDLNKTEQAFVEHAMSEKLDAEFRKDFKDGISYELFEKNGKKGLKLKFSKAVIQLRNREE